MSLSLNERFAQNLFSNNPTESEEPVDLIQHKLLQIINLSKSHKSSSGRIREF